MPRISPTDLVPLDELPQSLRGEIRLNLTLARLSEEFVDEYQTHIETNRGGFAIKTSITTNEGDSYLLEARRKIFPSNDFLQWLEEKQYDFSLRVASNGKSG